MNHSIDLDLVPDVEPGSILEGILDAVPFGATILEREGGRPDDYICLATPEQIAAFRAYAEDLEQICEEAGVEPTARIGQSFILGAQGHGVGLWDSFPSDHPLVKYERASRYIDLCFSLSEANPDDEVLLIMDV